MSWEQTPSWKSKLTQRLVKNSFTCIILILLVIALAVTVSGLIVFVWNLDRDLENWKEEWLWNLVWLFATLALTNAVLLLFAGIIKFRSCICGIIFVIVLAIVALVVVGILVSLEGQKLQEGQLAGCPLLFGNNTQEVVADEWQDFEWTNNGTISSESISASSSNFVFTQGQCSLFQAGFKMMLAGIATLVLLELLLLLAGFVQWVAIGRENAYNDNFMGDRDDKMSLLREQLVE